MSSRLLKSSRSNSVDPSANGCLDEEQFLASFVDVPKLNLYSQKDVTDKLTKIKEILNNASQDWDKRCLALKEIRSLIVQDQMRQLPDLQQQIRFLDIGLQTSLKDLRSQVVREACITVSYMAREFGGRFEYSAEPILQVLVPLMQNSAKVMATSAHTSIKFIIKAIHSPKLTTTIISNMSSKSNVIRKHCCEFVHIILNEWSRQELEKQSHALQQAITKGLSDADSEARYFSRKAFASFSMVFPEQGYSILSSFDASKQKQLLSELDDPNFFDSMSQFRTPVSKGRGVAPDLVASATPKAKASRFGFTPKPAANVFKTPATPKMTTPQRGVMAKVDTGMRSKFKVSQSTPTSRTGSPSRTPLRAANHPPPDVTPVACRTPLYGTLRTPRSVARNGSSVRKITSQSQCNSREVSPTRRMVVKSRPLLSGAVSGTLCTEGNGGNFSSMRSLPQSPCPDNIVEYGRNLEAAISDAWRQKANWFRSSDDVDAYSETSSVCSETSSYRSHSDMTEDTLGIMSRLVCGLWTERKEGLMMLQKFLRCGKRFNNAEIRKVLDIIMRMFHDSHPKVLASFFEVLADLVQAHHQDMMDLLPSIFSRLFSKAVSDVLGNLHDKISRTLDAIRISFPCDKQLAAVCKYITEQPATISIKAKQTILLYFLNLSSAIEPSALTNTSDIRASISKILTWTSEPKNAEVRKLSQSTIVTLARNCPDQLNAILSLMPKTYQDGAKKILSDQLGNNVNNNSHGTPVSGKTQKVIPRAHTPRSIFAVVEPRRGTPTKNAGQSDDGVDIWDGIAKASEELQQLSLLEVEELNEGLLEDSSHSMHVCNQDGDAETDLGNLLETIKDSKEVTEWCGLVNCLISFIKASNSRELWNIHFKMTYALILEAIQDAESPQRKLLGLQALREMLEKHSERFHPYAELTIMNLLETEKEKDRDVIRASDECRLILSRAFPLEQSIGILNPICLTATYPINMAAVKLLTKVFQFAPTEQIRDHVPVVAPGLVKGFEHEESGMRKSSMLCLVAIHKHIGEELMSYIKDLSQNKMKLLNVYIRKSSGEGD